MKKLRVCGLLIALILVMLVPAAALAAQVSVGGVGLEKGQYTLSGERAAYTGEPSGTGWAWLHDVDGQLVLTLNGYDNMNATYGYLTEFYYYDYYALHAETELTIELIGTNRLTGVSQGQGSARSNFVGIYHNKPLTIAGKGSLAAQGGDFGIYGDGAASLTMKSGTLDASAVEKRAAIREEKDIVIEGGAIKGSVSGTSAAITSVYGNISINGGAVTAVDREGNGLRASGDITITGGTINIQAHCAIEGRNVTIDNGEILIVSDIGMDARNGMLSLNGGKFDITYKNTAAYAKKYSNSLMLPPDADFYDYNGWWCKLDYGKYFEANDMSTTRRMSLPYAPGASAIVLPSTGDDAHLGLWVMLLTLSTLGIVLLKRKAVKA